LCLDELPEFNQRALEALRQPLEDKVVTIARAQGSLARLRRRNFMLVAAGRCGGNRSRTVGCRPTTVTRHVPFASGTLGPLRPADSGQR
jgi:magnesium chelatase family protein